MWTRYSERELLAAVLSIRSIMDVFSCSSKHTLLRPLLHNLCHFLTTALCPRKKNSPNGQQTTLTLFKSSSKWRETVSLNRFFLSEFGALPAFFMYSLDLACYVAWQTLCAGEPLQAAHGQTHLDLLRHWALLHGLGGKRAQVSATGWSGCQIGASYLPGQ